MFYILFSLCCLCAIWRLWFKRQSASEPPELSGRLPIVGHAYKIMGDGVHLDISALLQAPCSRVKLQLDNKHGMYKAVQKVSEECLQKGGLVVLYLPFKAYGVADPEDCSTVMQTCLKKHNFFDFGKPFLGNGLITADVPTWKRNRKILNPAFNQQVLDGFVEVFNTQALKLVDQFAAEVGKPFDHDRLLRLNNLETICITSLGVENGEYSDLRLQYLPHLTKLIQMANERVQKFWLHSEFAYNMSQLKRNLDEELEHILRLSKSIIKKKKLSHKENLTSKETTTGKLMPFMDLILELAHETGCFTDEQIREETDNVMAGGHDTSASTLTFALTVLGSRTDIQEKAFEEIFRVLGNTKINVDKDDLSKLVYIEAVLKETLRLYTIAPVLARRAEKDIKLKNYTIKANSDIFILNYGLHRHKMWGPDAEQFRPERWLDKETLPDPKYFGGFGLGRRACIGKAYAMMSMKIILAHVLRSYRVSSDLSKMVVQIHIMIRAESGHYICLEPRNHV